MMSMYDAYVSTFDVRLLGIRKDTVEVRDVAISEYALHGRVDIWGDRCLGPCSLSSFDVDH